MRWRTSFVGFLLACAAVMAVGIAGGCQQSGMRLERVEPPFGSIAGNDDVVIIGAGFNPGLTVQFNKRAAKKIVIESDQRRIRVKTPPGPEGQVDVIVTDETGRTYVLEKAFTYRKES